MQPQRLHPCLLFSATKYRNGSGRRSWTRQFGKLSECRILSAMSLTALQGSVSAQQLDLADLASVRAAAAALQQLDRIDMLILNAGIMVRV